MAAQKAPNIAIIGTDVQTLSIVAVDLPDAETALEENGFLPRRDVQ